MAGMAFSSAGLGYATRWRISQGRRCIFRRSGERHVAANGDGVQPDGLSERFSQVGRALRTKKSDDRDALMR